MANNLNNYASGQDQLDEDTGFQSFDSIRKLYEVKASEEKKYNELLEQMSKRSALKKLKDQQAVVEKGSAEYIRLEKQIQEEKKTIELAAIKATQGYQERVFKQGSTNQKLQLIKDSKEVLSKKRQDIDLQYKFDYEAAKGNAEKQAELAEQYHQKQAELAEEEKELSLKNSQLIREESLKELTAVGAAFKTLGSNFKNNFSVKGLSKDLGNLGKSFNKLTPSNIIESTNAAKEKVDSEISDIEDKIAKAIENGDDPKEIERLENEKKGLELQSKQLEAQKESAQYLKMLQDSYKAQFNAAEAFLTENSGRINARLQGTEDNFKDITDKITSTLSTSPYVKVTSVLDSMKNAVDQGIAYNIEQRAFLDSISDKIASTFNAFDSSLLRLIKLQQADLTIARMGMEASLTKWLNANFQDSSYLNNLYDTITSSILDASSQLNRDQSTEFEYTVQKWLSALSSVGLSDETISSIAQGINLLGTGDVQGLASNSSLQTLFAMSASKAGLEYSNILLEGLDANTTNRLLEGVVSYLKEIAESVDNQVVKAAYSDILNFNVSDMTAINNLSAADIENIKSQTMTYSQMLSETTNQLSELNTRVTTPEKLSNVYTNVLYGVASDMTNNPVTWGMNKMLNFMEDNNINVAIPFINAMGFGVDLNDKLVGLMKMGLGLSQAFSLVTNLFAGLGSDGGRDLGDWDAQEYMSRGNTSSLGLNTTLGETSSVQTFTTNMNQKDVKNSSLNSATDDAEETKEITNKNQPEATKTLDDVIQLFNFMFGEKPLYEANQIRIHSPQIGLVLNTERGLHVYQDDTSNSVLRVKTSTEDPLFVRLTDVENVKNILESKDGLKVKVLSSLESPVITKLTALEDVKNKLEGENGLRVNVANKSTGFMEIFNRIFGERAIYDNGNLKVFSSQLDSVIDIQKGLHIYQDDTSNSTVRVKTSSKEPLITKIIDLEDIKTKLEGEDGFLVKLNNVKALAEQIGKEVSLEGESGLAKKIAKAVSAEVIKVQANDINGLPVNVKNMPKGYVT